MASAESSESPVFSESLVLPSGDRYHGQLIHGTPNGQGKLDKLNGDQYEGVFVDGKFEGRGVYTWANGDVYKGKWKSGKRDGFGSLLYANGNSYNGEWKANVRHGNGQLTYRSGTRYEGKWKSNKKHGKGMLIYRSGQRYIGEYKNDLRHGKGVLIKQNGDSYRGTFSKNKEHGVGECSSAIGSIETCLFRKGVRITKKSLVDRAIKYQKQQASNYEFTGGIGFVFEDGFTKKRQYLRNDNVWWESKVALISTELKIKSESDNQFINFIIREYDGVGKYRLKGSDFLVAINGAEPFYIPEDTVATIEITSDQGGVIEGKFSIPSLVLANNNASHEFSIRDGRFEAGNSPIRKH